MKTSPGCKGAAKLNLKQCQLLVANGFLSKDGNTDYEHEEVISRLYELQAAKDLKNVQVTLRNLALVPSDELPPPIPHDAYLSDIELEAAGLPYESVSDDTVTDDCPF